MKIFENIYRYLKSDVDHGFSKREIEIFDYIANKTLEDFENSYFTNKEIQMAMNLPEHAIDKFVVKMDDIGVLLQYGTKYKKEWALNLQWE